MRRLIAAWAAILPLLATPAHAAEPEALLRTAVAPAAVALAGEEVLVADELTTVRVRALRSGQPARTLFEREAGGLRGFVGLGASRAHAAFALDGAALAGPAGGPFARQPAAARVHALDVAGSTLVTVESAPGAPEGPPTRLVARDLGPLGGAREIVSGRRLLPLVRAAGTSVAYAEEAGGRDVAVALDRATGTETSRVVLSGSLEALDVQDDGKLALATARTRTQTSISWTAPGRPGVREVARAARRSGVRIAADRIAYVRPAGISRELAVTDLDGFAAPASFPVADVAAFDFDGERLAFATRGCVYSERVPGLVVRAAPPLGPCARSEPRLRAPRRAGRALSVLADCPMATAAGCPVALTLVSGGRAAGTRRVRVPRGGERAVRLPLQAARPGRATIVLRPLDRPAAATLQSPITLTWPPRNPPRKRPPPEPDGPGGEFVIG